MTNINLAFEALLAFASALLATSLALVCLLRVRANSLTELATIVRSTKNSVITTDKHGKIVWVNDAFTEATGYTLQESLGRSPGELLQCEETSQHTIERMRRSIAENIEFHGEIVNRTKHGQLYWVELNIVPVHNRRGKLLGFTSIQRDITDRKQLEAQLGESQRLFSGALDASNVDIAILDAEGKILFVNEAWSTLANDNNSQASKFKVGCNYFEIVDNAAAAHREVALEMVAGIKTVLDGKCEHFEFEYPVTDSRQTRWYFLNVNRFAVLVRHEWSYRTRTSPFARKPNKDR